jgi:hypothetical protein
MMGTKGIWLAIGALFLAAVPLAQGSPTPTPTPGSSPSPTAAPTPVHTPLRAPTWAPTSAGTEPGVHHEKKGAHWLSRTGLGLAVPASPSLQSNYSLGFGADVGTGYRLSDRLSLWLDFGLSAFNAKNPTAAVNNNYTLICAALSLKYRLATSGLAPYLFAGPGLAYNESRNVNNPQYDEYTGILYIPVTAYEFDPVLQGGAGLELDLGDGAAFYLQGKVLCDYLSPSFAADVEADNQTLCWQLELGTLFGL